MKSRLLTFIAALLVSGELSAQTDYPGFRCYIDPSGGGTKVQSVLTSPFTGTTNMAILLCVEKGQQTGLSRPRFVDMLVNLIPQYFAKATFNNYHVNVIDVLVKDQTADSAHAFELAGTLDPYPDPNNPWHNPKFVVDSEFVRDVLNQADAIYDFGNYDGDNDGIVDYLALLVVRFAVGNQNGTTGLSIDDYYYTNDYWNGRQIKIDGNGYMSFAGKKAIIQRKKNPDAEGVLSMAAHELGHSIFSFPDVEHSGGTYFNHSSFGDFDPMSSGWGGFANVASLYNPGFRVVKGWVTPIDASGTKTFSDFDASGQIFSCTLPSNSNAYSNQKYYFTYYTKDPNNRWQANWEVPTLSDHITHAGVLAWRTIDGGSWSDRKAMPITLEAAHGKWQWNDNWPYSPPSDKHPTNTGQADILNGLDSLQLRYSYIWQSFTGYDQDGKATYANHLYRGGLYQVGSASCFFDPEHNRDFAFYTNPSSNEIASADESRSITPGFAMKNLRWEGGQAKADFVTGDAAHTITENATLTAGTWYINNTVTVAPGVTLTINPGAVLKFPSANIRITVNGNLNVAGTSSNPATIDFTAPYTYGMNGIQFNSGSGGSFSYCNIKNASYGIYASNATIAVDHCTISNCAQAGVYSSGQLPRITYSTFTGNGTAVSISNTGFVSYPWITGNTISSNRYGIYLYNSSPMYLEFNTVSGNTDGGVWCSHGSTPYMRGNTISGNGGDGLHAEDASSAHFGSYYGEPGLNVVRQNSRYGIYANSSNVYLGSTDTHYGMNSIYNNGSYELLATYNSNVMAQYNWWNYTYMPYYPPWDLRSENGGSFTAYPGLTWDPNSGRTASMTTLASVSASQETGTPGKSGKQPEVASSDTSFFDSELSAAMSKLSEGKHNEAIPLFARKFWKEKNERKKMYALDQLAECYRGADTSAAGRVTSANKFLEYLNKEVRPTLDKSGALYIKSLELESIALLDAGQIEEAVKALLTLKENFKDKDIQRNALFNLAYIHQNLLGNTEEGRGYFAQLKESYPDDELTRLGELVMVNFGGDAPNADMGANAEKMLPVADDSAEAALGNFPNPFNPTTAIRYQVPKAGQVTLKVYDILGREVATLVNEHQGAGVHSATFDGSRLASGVYFYLLTAPGINQVKKMLLTK